MPTRLLLLLLAALALPARAAPAPVEVIAINGAIGPAAEDYVRRGLERAAKSGAQLAVLKMDTPGGLDSAMRGIVKAILASPVPVACHVAPSGARAASAGTFILYACHFAAMAPGTNLGAASPIAIGGMPEKKDEKGNSNQSTEMRKATQDAAAYIRSLAQLRGRNAEWAEKAVREAVSLSADEALKMKVIDFVAPDLDALLERLDGREVTLAAGKVTLHTKGTPVDTYEPDWRTRFLAVITDPTIAYALLLVGIYALAFEFMNPGIMLPGVIGALALLVALYALHLLPVSYAGLALLLVGIGFMVAELFFPAYGSLGVGGAIAFVVGSVMLIDTDVPAFGLPMGLILGLAAGSALFVFGVAGMALRARRRPVVAGRETLVGASAEVLQDFAGEGWARVQGETWRVRSPTPLKAGARARVAAVQGLVLELQPERQA